MKGISPMTEKQIAEQSRAAMEFQRPHDAVDLYRQSTDAATMCKAIVTETAITIQGRKYVRVEGWQAIAIAHGCVASARDVERLSTGIRAIGEVIVRETGAVIATGEGFVGDDEKMWSGRPEYARRAMAQTRAISRACRAAFAHVVVMMRAGLETTPAEEVPSDGFDDGPRSKPPPRAERVPKGPSEAQLKRLHAIKRENGVPDEALRQWLYEQKCVGDDGEPTTKRLSKDQYDTLCNEWMPAYAAAQAEADAQAVADEEGDPF